MSPVATAVLERLLGWPAEGRGSGWWDERVATVLLASDDPRARYATRRLGQAIAAERHSPEADRDLWSDVEALLALPVVERCLAHARASHRPDAFALLDVPEESVERVVETLVDLAAAQPTQAEPFCRLHTLSALWVLRGASPARLARLVPRVRPERWIEHRELEALQRRASGDARSVERRAWGSPLHPTLCRDMLGGAWLRVALSEDPCDVFRGPAPVLPSRWLIAADLDGMLVLDDRHGHAAGDLVIRGVVQVLQKCVGDHVIRSGGDEFLVLYDGDDPASLAEQLCARVAAARFHAPPHTTEPLQVTMSAGVVRAGRTLDTIDAALRAVHEAKRAGRGRVHVAV